MPSLRELLADDFTKHRCRFLLNNIGSIAEADNRYLMAPSLHGHPGLEVCAIKPVSALELNSFMCLVYGEKDRILQRAMDYVMDRISEVGSEFFDPEISYENGLLSVRWKRFLEGQPDPTLFYVDFRYADLLPTSLTAQWGGSRRD